MNDTSLPKKTKDASKNSLHALETPLKKQPYLRPKRDCPGEFKGDKNPCSLLLPGQFTLLSYTSLRVEEQVKQEQATGSLVGAPSTATFYAHILFVLFYSDVLIIHLYASFPGFLDGSVLLSS